MAGAVVPIITTLLPTAIPYVVRLVDKLFPPKSGGLKKDAATEIVAAIAQGVQTALGKPGQPLTTGDITKAVQSVVDDLNAKGELKGPDTSIEPLPAAPAGVVGTRLSRGIFGDLLIDFGTIVKGLE